MCDRTFTQLFVSTFNFFLFYNFVLKPFFHKFELYSFVISDEIFLKRYASPG